MKSHLPSIPLEILSDLRSSAELTIQRQTKCEARAKLHDHFIKTHGSVEIVFIKQFDDLVNSVYR